jgi:hypothetical protein
MMNELIFSSMSSLVAPYLALVAGFAALWLYVLVRWRMYREGVDDLRVGAKFAVLFFWVASFHLLLIGARQLGEAMIYSVSGQGTSAMYRTALGLLLPGALLTAVHTVAAHRLGACVNPRSPLSSLFAGANLLFTGMMGFYYLVASSVVVTAASDGGDRVEPRLIFAGAAVYIPAWIVLGLRFLKPAPPAAP